MLVILAVLALAAPRVQAQGAGLEERDVAELEHALKDVIEIGVTPGMAVAIVCNHRVVYTRGFGVRSTEKGGSVDADTLFTRRCSVPWSLSLWGWRRPRSTRVGHPNRAITLSRTGST